MLFLITVVLIAYLVVSGVNLKKLVDPDGLILSMVAVAILLIIVVVADCNVAYSIRGQQVLENKIQMYQEENEKFEEKMAAIVIDYMKHESDVIEKVNINSETLTFYVAKYPELKSDELIKEQIARYTSNMTQITELKSQVLNIPRLRWLLYFG